MLDRLGALQQSRWSKTEQWHAANPVLARQAQVARDLLLAEARRKTNHPLKAVEGQLAEFEQMNNLDQLSPIGTGSK